MKVCGISDLHGNLEFEIKQEVDLITMSGDFSPLIIQRNYQEILDWCNRKFVPWIKRNLKKSNARWFVFCAGNHDFACENPNWKIDFYDIVKRYSLYNKVIYLENESVLLDKKVIFGCPYSDIPYWAFSISTGNEFGYKSIQNDVDLLIVHQAPDIEGLGTSNIGTNYERNFGSASLNAVIDKTMPKNVVCGHIHSGNHNKVTIDHGNGNMTNLYNASLLDEHYKLNYNPQYFII